MGLAPSDLQTVQASAFNLEQRTEGFHTFSGYRHKTKVPLDIPVMHRMADTLKEHPPEPAGRVCPALPSSESSALDSFRTVVRHAGLPETLGWYDLRHSFATMIRSVYSEDYAAFGRLMGHKHGSPMMLPPEVRSGKSDRLVGKRYDHPSFARCAKVVARLDALLAG